PTTGSHEAERPRTMSSAKTILAYDLGAESGRAILGAFDGQRLSLEVLHRFANGPVRTLDTMHWDVLRLYSEMLHGMRLAAGKGGVGRGGTGPGGVDSPVTGRAGRLVANPRHSRDPHTEDVMAEAFARVSGAEIYRHTGIQHMRFNTLYQLLAMQRDNSPQ